MYDERVYIIEKVLKKKVYPSYDEIVLHENKRYLSYWLKAEKLPHPETHVFYKKKEALEFIENSCFPIVGKINIGASGKGVTIFKTKSSALKYVEDAFSIKGIKQSTGPNLKMGNIANRIVYVMKNPAHIKKRVSVYSKIGQDKQKNFVIFQKFIPHDFEWRIVRIGESYFGHKKIKTGEKASGTKGIDYEIPPDKLLNFVKEICDNYNFNSMAVDIFEDGKGGYLINEMQTAFGHVQDYICEKDRNPGRLIFENYCWIFEQGMFNANLSFNLRLKNVIDLIQKKNI